MKKLLLLISSALLALCLFSCEKKPELLPLTEENLPIWKVIVNGKYASPNTSAASFTAIFPDVTDFSAIEVVISTSAQEITIGGQTVQPDQAFTLDLTQPQPFRVIKDGYLYKDYILDAHNTGLPVVRVETPSHRAVTSKEEWMDGATIRIELPDGTLDYEGPMEIRGRGNSTWNYPKKPYALKLKDKAEILSMPSHKRWILLANWKDRTILRNDAAFWLSRHSGLQYTVRGQFVELVFNGKHAGNYYLCEQIKPDKNRVNIDKKKGYLLEVDTYYDEPNKFRFPNLFDLPWMVKSPDEDEITPQQLEYIKTWLKDLETLLKDPAKVKDHAYEEFLDVDTAIDYLIVEELTTNRDFYNTWPSNGIHSCYMYMDPGGKLYSGPIWDFDFQTWVPELTKSWQGADKTLFYPALLKDEKFRNRLLERWDAQKAVLKGLPDYIDQMADYLRESESINHGLWPINNNENGDEKMTFQESIDRIKKCFLEKWEWMDRNIANLR